MNIDKTGLVLEGGGMRGIFTCGVLDYFLDNNIEFPYVVGVSAGACNGLSYISKQRGRGKKTNIDVLESYNFMGFKHLFTKRSFLDFDFLFHDVPERILPYDYESYFRSTQRFEMVTTNCLTGKPNYLEEKENESRVIDIVKASSSLPILCPITYVDDVPMLDGGVCDCIPIKRAISQGYKKNVVVLTRNEGYRNLGMELRVPNFVYRKYPKMRQALGNMNEMYNAQMELVEKLEREGKIIAIRPQNPIEVDRLEKDTDKLNALYKEGYEVAKRIMESIKSTADVI